MKGAFATVTALLMVVLLTGVTATLRGGAPPPPADRWEYGQLHFVEGKIRWLENGRVVEATKAPDAMSNLIALEKTLGGNASPAVMNQVPIVGVYNALGQHGWEFAYEDPSRSGASDSIWFKRRRW